MIRFYFLLLCGCSALVFAQSKSPPAADLITEEVTEEMQAALDEPDGGRLPLYLRMSRNSQPDVRAAAIINLTAIDSTEQSTAAVLARRADPAAAVREAVLEYIFAHAITAPIALQTIEQALSDPESLVRNKACHAVLQFYEDGPQLTQALLKALGKSDGEMTREILFTLGRMNLPPERRLPITAAVITRQSDPSVDVRQAVIQYLDDQCAEDGATYSPAVQAAIERGLNDSARRVRGAAIQLAGTLGTEHPELVTALVNRLGVAGESVETAILSRLQTLDRVPPEAAPLLEAAVERHGEKAILAMAHIKPPPPALIPKLRTILIEADDDAQSVAAAEVLGRYGDVPFLLAQAETGNLLVRANAIRGLGRVAQPSAEVRAAQRAALQTGDEITRMAAAWGLGQAADPSEEVLLALCRACGDKSGPVRKTCLESLHQLLTEQSHERIGKTVTAASSAAPSELGLQVAQTWIAVRSLDFRREHDAAMLQLYEVVARRILQDLPRLGWQPSRFEKREFSDFFYIAGCCAAHLKNRALALQFMEACLRLGCDRPDQFSDSFEYESLRETEEFKAILKKYVPAEEDAR